MPKRITAAMVIFRRPAMGLSLMDQKVRAASGRNHKKGWKKDLVRTTMDERARNAAIQLTRVLLDNDLFVGTHGLVTFHPFKGLIKLLSSFLNSGRI